jgi:uncharacterized protein (TIGR03083 family)
MTKRELLEAIQKGRAEFEAMLAGLSPAQMTTPGVMGEWSVKDILGHLAMWESRLVTTLYAIERGATPKMFHTQAEVDKANAESYAEQRDRPLDRVLSDFHAVHAQLLKRLETVTDRDLTDPQRFKWMEGELLEKLVASDTFDHYAEHRPMIEAWRSRIADG